MAAMGAAVKVPVTVKCRIGVDDQDPELSLYTLVDACVAAGVSIFVVHARKAWLKGLSPKENRDIPPLDYDLVRRLKADRPNLTISLNGGISTLDQGLAELGNLDGLMLGRAAYHDPGLLGAVDQRLFGAGEIVTPEQAIEAYRPYIARQMARGVPFAAISRHMLGLFQGRPGARAFRRIMTVDAVKPGAGPEVLDRALAELKPRTVAGPSA
jgi:tRNA-dihydrouridine synthase A